VLLTIDSDLTGAVLYSKSSGLKVLKLHVEDPGLYTEVTKPSQELAPPPSRSGISTVHVGLMAGAVALSAAAVMIYLKRSQL